MAELAARSGRTEEEVLEALGCAAARTPPTRWTRRRAPWIEFGATQSGAKRNDAANCLVVPLSNLSLLDNQADVFRRLDSER